METWQRARLFWVDFLLFVRKAIALYLFWFEKAIACIYFKYLMSNLKQLHERDFNLWIQEMAIAIKSQDVNAMDWENLLDEIQDMGASQKRALRSYYYRLVEHILKLRDWQLERDRNEVKWRVEVSNFRREIKDILADSPSLKSYLKDNHIDWFNKAVTGIIKSKAFSIEDTTAIPLTQMMNEDFFGI